MDAVSTAFSALMGREPAGLWSAPGRVNLIGEHTDYNAGLALPIALPHRTYAACAPRGDDLLRVQSLQQDRGIEITIDQIAPDQPGGWAAYVAGVIWAMRAEGIAAPGLDVVVDGQVPLGAGLSSSAALECSVAAAAADLAGTDLMNSAQGRGLLAQCADRAENEIALAPTGGMDQLASMLCQRDHALLLDCRDGRTEQVPFDLGAHELALLVTDTRAEHALVNGQYAQRRRSCEQAARRLGVASLREISRAELAQALAELDDDLLSRRARHVVTEIDRVERAVTALAADDYEGLGELFLASHASLRDDYEVTVKELDLAVETACAAGALGARMTGGGFGGSTIALVPANEADAIAAAVERAFADANLRPPASFMATAGHGARRER
jgi:galactokinase